MHVVDGDAGTGARHSVEKQQDHIHTLSQVAPKEQPQQADIPSHRPEVEPEAQPEVQPDASQQDLQQIWNWNKDVPLNLPTCMHNLIAKVSSSQPSLLAVESHDGTFTYRELEDLSTRLAHHLITLGVTIGTRVPLCFEKSRWAVVALLGVMKAGATFSLTDPSQPEARLRTIMEQTGAKIVVTSASQEGLGQKINPAGQVVVVSQDALASFPLPADEEASLPSVPPSSPMYVIFTSGSTGKPKGVVISHENYTSGAVPRAAAVGYHPGSRVFDFPSYAFDVSIDCMLCTLSVGGCICIPSDEMRMNDLSGAIRLSRANMVHMTPSVARVLDEDIIPSLEVLGLGGEAVGGRDAVHWGEKTKLIIAYGPSECTVGCTINNQVQESTGIGKGVGGVTWIVDPEDHDRLTPLGEVGELLVEGPLVGIGYLDEPAKTAEVFIEDPIWLTAGGGSVAGRKGRLYKTGDLVRYELNGSGSVEFVGRKDQQVKLRGQRVELAEVEHHVRECLPPGVRVAAEVIKPENGAPTLMAFLNEPSIKHEGTEWVTQPSGELKEVLASIDEALAAKVPRYMVPAAFVSLREMPSLVSGKTDRKKLREIGLSVPRGALSKASDATEVMEDPETDYEVRLAAVWVEVLGTETKIYRGSNFFQLGGDSLRAMRLVSAAREAGIELTVGLVFTHPTLTGMASKASDTGELAQNQVAPFSLLPPAWDADSAKQQAAQLCSISSEEVQDVYPCTPLQEALMALSAKIKEAYVAQRVVKLDSAEQGERLVAAFQAVSADCAILRTRIVQVPGRGLMQVVLEDEFPCETWNDLEEYLERDREQPMELGTPLVRYALFNDSKTKVSSFILTIHHALYDGWSMPLIISRVNAAYLSQPLTSPAPFNHFISYLSLQKRENSAKFWKDRLQGASGPQFPALPQKGYQTRADSLQEIYIPLPPTASFGVTAATIIRAAWALVASQYISSDDIVFGETLTGRNAPLAGVEGIEGPMITTVPFRVATSRDVSVQDFLQQVQDQTVEQIPHEHFGLQHIRRLSPDAFEACELRTGLVLHPSSAEEEELDRSLPANRLVPAGDGEAAREALKFNTYALMLVCSIDPKGFLVMASWDSQCLELETLNRVLETFKLAVTRLCEGTGFVGDIELLTEGYVEELKQWRGDTSSLEYQDVQGAHVVDPRDGQRLLPLGATGELIVLSTAKLGLPVLDTPSWLHRLYEQPPKGKFYKTGKLASLTSTSVITHRLDTPTAPTPPVPRPNQTAGSASTNKQRLLRTLWSRVLSKPEAEISPPDNFFILGGDSISAMKLVSEARGEGLLLTVVDIFRHKTLSLIAETMALASPEHKAANHRSAEPAVPYSLLPDLERASIIDTARKSLANPGWEIQNIFPARPLQAIAVDGTVAIPRFSARYELLSFTAPVDLPRLRSACQSLVSQVEILRTVFVHHHQRSCYSVVLSDLRAEFTTYEIDSDVTAFSHQLAKLDVQTRMPLGSSFVKWFFVTNADKKESCLIMRISHAQYDELALPLMLTHLSSLYTSSSSPPPQPSIPYSSFVSHTLKSALPASLPYWTSLLQDSQMSILRPDVPVTDTAHHAISQTVSIAARPQDVTIATLPTAAWALVLARRLSIRDILFGHVVSGRADPSFPSPDRVAGPCWSYMPVRLHVRDDWTISDLLSATQAQLVSSAPHASASLSEIAAQVPSLKGCDWFDTVVHQDVQHVHGASYGEGMRAMGVAGQDTVYPHEEPLREWKVQAFVREGGKEMEVEVVTVRSWEGVAAEVLREVVDAVGELVGDQGRRLF